MNYYCKNCGFVGWPKRYAPGSLFLEIILFLCAVFPWIIYRCIRSTKKYYGCPRCGAPHMIPAETGIAHRLGVAPITAGDTRGTGTALCANCGQPISADAMFCAHCGKRLYYVDRDPSHAPANTQVVSPAGTSEGSKPHRSRISLKLLLLVVCIAAVFRVLVLIRSQQITNSPEGIQRLRSVPEPPGMPPPPKFHLFRFKTDQPVTYVVPIDTSDQQLKSLLWLFRKSVRSGDFKKIGITRPMVRQYGQLSYTSGMLVVYRGRKCASEIYVDNVGPCGPGPHESASYQWGLLGDDNRSDFFNDAGNIGGQEVFSYKDGWHLPSEMPQVVDQKVKQEWEQGHESREQFAAQLVNELNAKGVDVDAAPDLDISGWTLVITARSEDPERFTGTDFRGSLEPLENSLCAAGFRKIRISQKKDSRAGQSYPLQCQ